MLRNKEFRWFSLLFLFLAIISIIAGFIINWAAGILAIATSVAFGMAFYIFTKSRYRNLSRISNQIDLVLHNVDRMEFSDFEEGELSILYNEITKMTLRIREQNDALKKDKQYLSDSLADIAHQLRTPLTSVNLILSLLAKNSDKEKRQAFIHELESLLIRMDWLIHSLLKISRLDADVVEFQNQVIPIKTLIASAMQPLAIPMDLRNIDLQVDIPEEFFILGDLNWLSEAIQNILKNCMESVGEHGKIEIACHDNTLYTEIMIHDNGAGFEENALPRLFERFYQGENPNTKGYGIGLALCKMIISKQNGTVTAKNHPHGGAVFSIRFSK